MDLFLTIFVAFGALLSVANGEIEVEMDPWGKIELTISKTHLRILYSMFLI